MAGHLPCLSSFARIPAYLPDHEFIILCSDLYINVANSSADGSTVRGLLGFSFSPRYVFYKNVPVFFFSFLVFSYCARERSVPADLN